MTAVVDTWSAPAADASQAFVVELDDFSGPLDLLLTLIREDRIDIADIPIARVAEQFLARIQTLALDDAAEYLEMAARLLRIKAQMLLPRTAEGDEWEDPRAELVRRLLEYQQMREVVDLLEVRAEDRRNRFARAYFPETAEPVFLAASLSLVDLFAALDRVLRVARKPDAHDVMPRPLDVDGAIAVVRAALATRSYLRWTELLPDNAEAWQILSLLLALLELARRGELRIAQSRPFAPVEVTVDAASEAA